MLPTTKCELLAEGLKASADVSTHSDAAAGSVARESTCEVAGEEQRARLDEAERAAAHAARIELRRSTPSASSSDGRAVARLTLEVLLSTARPCTRYVQQSWPRILGAVLSLGVGGFPGWMLVTRTWTILNYVPLPPASSNSLMPWETPFDIDLTGYYGVLATAAFCAVTGKAVLRDLDAPTGWLIGLPVGLVGLLVFCLYRSNNLGPCIGWGLILAGVVGALFSLLHCSDDAAVQASSSVEAAPSSPEQAPSLVASLDKLIAGAPEGLPDAAHTLLRRIRACVDELAPRLLRDSFPWDDRNTVEQAVRSWLPDTLASYAALPRPFREQEILQNGRTAQSAALEQLERIEAKLGEVRARANHAEAVPLLVQGLFLERLLARPDDSFLKGTSTVQGPTPAEFADTVPRVTSANRHEQEGGE
jgi:hypothetical protein